MAEETKSGPILQYLQDNYEVMTTASGSQFLRRIKPYDPATDPYKREPATDSNS
jgi:hypothetical protein